MPAYNQFKRRRITYRRYGKVGKKATAPLQTMVYSNPIPRPKFNAALRYHKFIRTTSTSQTDLNLTGASGPIQISTSNSSAFSCAGASGMNLNMFFTISGTYLVIAGTNPQILNMPNYAELTTLYDQYRIDCVQVSLYFSNNSTSLASTTVGMPVIGIVKDYDDANAAAFNDIQQYDNFQSFQLGNATNSGGKYTFWIKPSCKAALNSNSVGYGFAQLRSQFVDCNYPLVQHYGVKMCIDPILYASGVGTQIGQLSIETKYYLTMKHSR